MTTATDPRFEPTAPRSMPAAAERSAEPVAPRRPLELVTDLATGLLTRVETWIVADKRALHGLAVSRILVGFAIFGLLFTNFRVRNILWGPGAVWNGPMRDSSDYAPVRLIDQAGTLGFGLFYVGVMVVALAFTLGWHARLTGILLVVGNTAIIEQNPVLGDQGDNAIRVGLILLCFMHTTEHWSLDARRRRRTQRAEVTGSPVHRVGAVLQNAWRSQRVLPLWFSNTVHNVALAALAFNVLCIYISAGMFKTQGQLWQRGTALYYPLQLQEYKPFPLLSDTLTHYGVVVGVATYMAVFVQLFFAPMLLHRVTRRLALVFIVLLHLSIAVLMALPWFSLAMIAYDAIFVSTATYLALQRWAAPRAQALSDRFFDVWDPLTERFVRR